MLMHENIEWRVIKCGENVMWPFKRSAYKVWKFKGYPEVYVSLRKEVKHEMCYDEACRIAERIAEEIGLPLLDVLDVLEKCRPEGVLLDYVGIYCYSKYDPFLVIRGVDKKAVESVVEKIFKEFGIME